MLGGSGGEVPAHFELAIFPNQVPTSKITKLIKPCIQKAKTLLILGDRELFVYIFKVKVPTPIIIFKRKHNVFLTLPYGLKWKRLILVRKITLF